MQTKKKLLDYIFYIFSTLLIGSAVAYLFEQKITPYIYTVSAAAVTVLFLINLYKGDNLRMKRLNIQQVVAALSLSVSSYFMCVGRNEWYIFLLVSGVLMLYIVLIRDYELKKNGKDNEPAK